MYVRHLRHIAGAMMLAVLASLALSPTTSAQVVMDSVAELQGIDVEEHLGEQVSPELQFTTHDGRQVTLGDYFNQDKPIMLILGYYECPMLCNLVFNGVSAAISQLEWMPGEQYQILTVSIDAQETPDLAQAKRKNYLADIGRPGTEPGWVFMVGDESQSSQLAEELGFQYYYDEDRDEWAHPAVVFILTEDGKISRYLYGINFKPNDVKLSLLEASNGKIGSPVEKLILYCFHYDPDAKGYVVFAGNVMKLGGLVTLIALGLFIAILWLRERRKRADGDGGQTEPAAQNIAHRG